MAMMDKVKVACVVGTMASIVALILGTKGIKTAGIAGLVACIAGMALAYVNTEYPKWLAIGGLVLGVPAGGYAVFVMVRALKEVVGNVEHIKKDSGNLIGESGISKWLNKQSPSTKAVVKKVRAKIKEPENESE